METLVAVGQQDQFHNRNRGGRNNGYSYSSSFRDINCRSSFQSGPGVVASSYSNNKTRSPPVTKPNSPRTPPLVTPNKEKKQVNGSSSGKRIVKSKSVPIPLDSVRVNMNDGLFYSELWAGPAYSNSPPPSSLPIPRFSVKPKRTVSLELPSVRGGDVDLLGMFAKSAPASPTREHSKLARRNMFVGDGGDDEFATKTLRRILNLDE